MGMGNLFATEKWEEVYFEINLLTINQGSRD